MRKSPIKIRETQRTQKWCGTEGSREEKNNRKGEKKKKGGGPGERKVK